MVPHVSIIIPLYRSACTIEHTLESIFSQKTGFCYEVIVVDSSPVASDTGIGNRFAERIRLIRLDKKTFPGVARNIGAREAQSPLLMFIDADIVLAGDWIEKAVLFYRSNHRLSLIHI